MKNKSVCGALPSCVCDICMGACNNGKGGKGGMVFACEAIADDEDWWEINREDALQL